MLTLSNTWSYHYIQLALFVSIKEYVIQTHTFCIILLASFSLSLVFLCFIYYLLNRQIKCQQAELALRFAQLQQTNEQLQRELSERKRTKGLLQESEERFRSAFENAGIGMAIVATNGRWLRVNRSLCEIVGYSESELLTTTFQAITHPEDLDTDLDYMHQMLGDEIRYYEMEKRYFHKQGHVVWILLSGSLVRDPDGQPLYFIAQIQDITQRKQAEEALRESERRFRAIFDQTFQFIGLLKPDGTLLEANQTALDFGGINHADIVGRPFWEARWWTISSEIQNQLKDAIARAATGEFVRYEVEVLGRGEIVVTIDFSLKPVKDPTGKIVLLIPEGRDISERKRVEKMKNEFISIVSHELRTPLASIQGSLGLLASGRLNNLPQKAQRMLDIAKAETERLTRLVNDILDLERLESGKVCLNKTLCNAATLMEQAVESVQSLAEEAKIVLVVSPLSVQIWADWDRIIQTLVNLLSNAIKFSPPQTTVELSAKLSQNLTPNIPQVVFQIKDQGRGIPADKLETIFRRFQQVDASDARTKGGTGLGLAICHTIVQQHGGHIWAESTLGQGSIFYFTLPLLQKSNTSPILC
ncbi:MULTISPECIES: PAS domain S-box protein [Nostocales]|uniref:histidine kinase n=3 Tax=Nostocales TaxID=1161 RepID=A0A8S9TFL6_9CYAN|nr:PAS domain S-box protein [Tolypothrix bouteillei]KAF3890394.1 PAS domain S-box protein [Tolypothrix bouteillei VB521301]